MYVFRTLFISASALVPEAACVSVAMHSGSNPSTSIQSSATLSSDVLFSSNATLTLHPFFAFPLRVEELISAHSSSGIVFRSREAVHAASASNFTDIVAPRKDTNLDSYEFTTLDMPESGFSTGG